MNQSLNDARSFATRISMMLAFCLVPSTLVHAADKSPDPVVLRILATQDAAQRVSVDTDSIEREVAVHEMNGRFGAARDLEATLVIHLARNVGPAHWLTEYTAHIADAFSGIAEMDSAEQAQIQRGVVAAFSARKRFETGDIASAQRLYRQAVFTYREHLGSDHILTTGAIGSLAAIEVDLGRLQIARDLYTAAFDSQTKMLGAESPVIVHLLSPLAAVNADLGNLDAAESQIREAHRIISKKGHVHWYRTAELYRDCAHIYNIKKQYLEAEFAAQAGAALTDRSHHMAPDVRIRCAWELARSYAGQGCFETASEVYAKLASEVESLVKVPPPRMRKSIFLEHAAVLSRLGKLSESQSWTDKANAIVEPAVDDASDTTE
jgi:tetratricopeptide (TPR) repeat protein